MGRNGGRVLSSSVRVSPEILGREDELAQLQGFFADAAQGPAAFVLEGDAGAGKTTLWLAGVEMARERGLHVLTARPAEAERELANVVLGDLFAESLGGILPELPAPRRRALEAALLLEGGDGGAAGPRELGVAVQTALRLLARIEPLVLAVDDCQWLDASSASTLAFALRRTGDAPLLLLLARRTEAPTSRVEDGLHVVSVTTLRVAPLTLGAVQALVRSRLGRSFARPLLVRVHEVSGGNPFYALELARALDARAAVAESGAPLPMPESLESLVGDRIRALAEPTRAALLVLAALGRATRSEAEEAGIALADVAPAIDAQVIEIAGEELRFTHPLLASAVYVLATDRERRGVHRRLARVALDPVSRARHLAIVVEEPDAEAAATLEAAAGVARARGAAAAAAELGEAAARASLPDERADARRRTARAARDHLAAGGVDRALAVGRELLNASASGDERAEALVLLAEFEELAGDMSRNASHLREALLAAGDAPRLRALAHQRLAVALWLTGSIGEAEEHGREALRRAEEVSDDGLMSSALGALAIVRFALGEPDSYALAQRAYDLTARLDDDAAGGAATALGHVLAWSGRIDEARRIFTDDLRSVADRDERRAAEVRWYLSLVEARAGRLELAREYAEHARAFQLEYSPPEVADDPGVAVQVANTAAHQGDHELARELAERGVAFADAHGELSTARFLVALLGMLDHWSGNPAAAVERFDALERARRAAGRSHATSLHVADHVEALLALGRLTDAAAVLEDWEAQARKLRHLWAGPQVVRSRGLLAAARGEVEEALGLLEEAVSRHESIGDPFGRARALLALGVTRRRARQKRGAREAIEAAVAGFDEIGAAGWAETARAELGSIGGRTRAEGLTPAERRVAVLAAEGRTNREVAAALSLGERTVETHLSHVYAKLGLRSRTELARVLR